MRKRIGTRSFDTERSSLVACSAESVEGMRIELYRSNNGTLFFCYATPAGRDLTETTFQAAEEWLERNGHSSALLGARPEDDMHGLNIELSNSALLRLGTSPHSRAETVARLIDEYL